MLSYRKKRNKQSLLAERNEGKKKEDSPIKKGIKKGKREGRPSLKRDQEKNTRAVSC